MKQSLPYKSSCAHSSQKNSSNLILVSRAVNVINVIIANTHPTHTCRRVWVPLNNVVCFVYSLPALLYVCAERKAYYKMFFLVHENARPDQDINQSNARTICGIYWVSWFSINKCSCFKLKRKWNSLLPVPVSTQVRRNYIRHPHGDFVEAERRRRRWRRGGLRSKAQLFLHSLFLLLFQIH